MKRQKPLLKPSNEELRRCLQYLTWGVFRNNTCRRINNIDFYCRVGLHLNRGAVAVMAAGQFVAIKYINWEPQAIRRYDKESRSLRIKTVKPESILDPERPYERGYVYIRGGVDFNWDELIIKGDE